MKGSKTGELDPAHLAQWLKTTQRYLFADRGDAPDGARLSEPAWEPRDGASRDAKDEGNVLRELSVGSRGAQMRFVARVRGRVGRLLRRSPPHPESALQELALAFDAQVAFIARNPEVPRRILRWSLETGDGRIHRRIRKTIDYYVTRLSRIVLRAQRQGEIAPAIEPRRAALLLVALVQSFALSVSVGLHSPDHALGEARALFALYLESIVAYP